LGSLWNDGQKALAQHSRGTESDAHREIRGTTKQKKGGGRKGVGSQVSLNALKFFMIQPKEEEKGLIHTTTADTRVTAESGIQVCTKKRGKKKGG